MTPSLATSGAIQYGVPIKVFLRFTTRAAVPESLNLTLPLEVTNILSPLISL